MKSAKSRVDCVCTVGSLANRSAAVGLTFFAAGRLTDEARDLEAFVALSLGKDEVVGDAVKLRLGRGPTTSVSIGDDGTVFLPFTKDEILSLELFILVRPLTLTRELIAEAFTAQSVSACLHNEMILTGMSRALSGVKVYLIVSLLCTSKSKSAGELIEALVSFVRLVFDMPASSIMGIFSVVMFLKLPVLLPVLE